MSGVTFEQEINGAWYAANTNGEGLFVSRDGGAWSQLRGTGDVSFKDAQSLRKYVLRKYMTRIDYGDPPDDQR